MLPTDAREEDEQAARQARLASAKVRRWPAWKFDYRVVWPSYPGTPTMLRSLYCSGSLSAHLEKKRRETRLHVSRLTHPLRPWSFHRRGATNSSIGSSRWAPCLSHAHTTLPRSAPPCPAMQRPASLALDRSVVHIQAHLFTLLPRTGTLLARLEVERDPLTSRRAHCPAQVRH